MEQQDNMEQQGTGQPGAGKPSIDVGAVLREARESAGMSVEEVAGRIKFAPRQIAALESGDFSRLPEIAFIRGFVRSYARLLELDDKPLLDALPGAPAPVAVQAKSMGGEVPRRGTERQKQNLFWLGGAVVLVAVVIIAWKYDSGEVPQDERSAHPGTTAVTGSPAPAAVAASAPVAAGQALGASAPAAMAVPSETVAPAHTAPKTHAAEKPKTPSKVTAREQAQTREEAQRREEAQTREEAQRQEKAAAPATPESALQAGSAAVMQAAPKMAPGAASSVAAASQGASHPAHAARSLRVEFAEDSWVEVKDGTGRTLLSMMGKQGSTRTVSGPPPLHVVVGNAKGVKLFYKGQPVELAPAGGGSVARLKLE